MALGWFKKKNSHEHQEERPSASESVAADNAKVGDTTDFQRDPHDMANGTAAQDFDAAGETGVGMLGRLKSRLSKTRQTLTGGIDKIFSARGRVDDDLLEELEELLITSDIGMETTMTLMQRISKRAGKIADAPALKEILREEILALLPSASTDQEREAKRPQVIMVVGVNGVGKTTTIGKIAAKYTSAGKKVLIAAADTFRAAAIEQLSVWADRAGAEIVKHKDHADPAAVAYDGIEAAIARNADVVLVDTAGRLHTKVNLMEELKKIKRTLAKRLADAPHETLLVLDATTGQNAISQVKLFNEAIGVSAIALTKLDGSAKGGVVVSICGTFQLPLKYIGIGEKIEDLQEFVPADFVRALL